MARLTELTGMLEVTRQQRNKFIAAFSSLSVNAEDDIDTVVAALTRQGAENQALAAEVTPLEPQIFSNPEPVFYFTLKKFLWIHDSFSSRYDIDLSYGGLRDAHRVLDDHCRK